MQKILASWNSNSDVIDENSWGDDLAFKSPDHMAEIQDEGDVSRAEKSHVNQKKSSYLRVIDSNRSMDFRIRG